MSSLALDYTYRYPFASGLDGAPGSRRLRLATSGGSGEHPYFFRGMLTRPLRTADLLRGLVQVVHSRFHVPPAMLTRGLAQADPVITSNGDVLRFEAFSACCSTYARVDLLPAAIDGELTNRGTTNVDFNAPLRAALARVRDGDDLGLSVGAAAFELARGAEAVVEKKVALPLRWLRGFVEVQVYQARMKPYLEVSGAEAARFLRALPRTPLKGAAWVVRAGRGLRLSHHGGAGGACVGGVQRLRVLEDLARHAQSLRVYADADSRTSAWTLLLDEARFHLVLSPEVWRGFSGEGQALTELAGGAWQGVLPGVRAALKWQSRIDAPALAGKLALPAAAVTAALGALGSRGLCGYDLVEEAYFHRELPFDLSKVEALQPRLKDARRLVERGGVQVLKQGQAQIEAAVAGSGVEHRVRLSGEEARCTCPWFARHQGRRGPCKHVLAVQIVLDGRREKGDEADE